MLRCALDSNNLPLISYTRILTGSLRLVPCSWMVKAPAEGLGLAVTLNARLCCTVSCASWCWDEVLACAVINEQSSSLMVTIAILSLIVAWQALLKSTSNCSVGSQILSLTIG